MVTVIRMGDEDDLRERDVELAKDRIEQARWYESLNLFGEAMRIYRSIKDEENIERLRNRIASDYRKKASDMEKAGRFQDAANLFFIIGDNDSVLRMKGKDPSLVILYDEKAGGISQLGTDLDLGKDEEEDRFFKRPNEEPEAQKAPVPGPSGPSEGGAAQSGRTGLVVRMPKKSANRFCPYCGEGILTKKEAKFCPSCGEEI
jgi:predicted RNA-binding Zn-ribbon protein involved in translation (DUF1610 family)